MIFLGKDQCFQSFWSLPLPFLMSSQPVPARTPLILLAASEELLRSSDAPLPKGVSARYRSHTAPSFAGFLSSLRLPYPG